MAEETNAEETSSPDVKALADQVISDLKAVGVELKEELAEVKERDVKDAMRNLPDVIKAVEKLAATVKLTGAQKKDVVVEIINRLIDIPLIPESIEARIISGAIDAVVAAFNSHGKKWLGLEAA